MLRPRRDVFRALPAPQHRLELTPLQGGVHRLPDAGKVRHQGAGFAVWIVLTKGYKKIISSYQQLPDVPGGRAESIVGGDRDDYRSVVAQMGLGRHGHRRIRDACGQLPQGIAGTGGDDQGVQQLLRANGLRIADAPDGRMSGQALHLGQEGFRRPEAGICRLTCLGDDGEDRLILPAQLCKLFKNLLMGAEGAA